MPKWVACDKKKEQKKNLWELPKLLFVDSDALIIGHIQSSSISAEQLNAY